MGEAYNQMFVKLKEKRSYNYALILIYGIIMFIGGIATDVAYNSYIAQYHF